MTRTMKLFGAALGLLAAATACNNDQLFDNPSLTPVSPLFARYASLGNSITAGFQSAGINDSTQAQGYPVLLARSMQTPFFPPYLNRPGCPPPYTNVWLQSRVAGGTGATCALRKTAEPGAPDWVNNVAVPGATALSPTDNNQPGSNTNQLTVLMLGGLTQIGMLRRVQPTFVTAWIGNNDVLGAATAGDTLAGDSLLVTDTATFKAEYTAMLDSLAAIGSIKGGVLIGVADVTQIPFFSLGQVYFAIKNTTSNFPANFVVSPDCAPSNLGGVGDSTLVSFVYGLGLVNAAAADTLNVYTLDCTAAQVVTKPELIKLHQAVLAYNAFIAAQASARGWAYFDPNVALGQLRADTTQVAVFPRVPPDPRSAAAPFGTGFSLDGIHPSTTSQKLIANALIQVINAKYGTALKAIP